MLMFFTIFLRDEEEHTLFVVTAVALSSESLGIRVALANCFFFSAPYNYCLVMLLLGGASDIEEGGITG